MEEDNRAQISLKTVSALELHPIYIMSQLLALASDLLKQRQVNL